VEEKVKNHSYVSKNDFNESWKKKGMFVLGVVSTRRYVTKTNQSVGQLMWCVGLRHDSLVNGAARRYLQSEERKFLLTKMPP